MVIRTAAVRTGYSNKHHNRQSNSQDWLWSEREKWRFRGRSECVFHQRHAFVSVFFTCDMHFWVCVFHLRHGGLSVCFSPTTCSSECVFHQRHGGLSVCFSHTTCSSACVFFTCDVEVWVGIFHLRHAFLSVSPTTCISECVFFTYDM